MAGLIDRPLVGFRDLQQAKVLATFGVDTRPGDAARIR